MSINRPKIENIQLAMASSVQKHWGLFLAEGIILTILGVGAIVVPPLATLAVEILVGWLFLVSGVVGLVMTLRLRSAPGFLWSLVSAVIGIAAGIVLLVWPLNGITSLTFVLIAFFVIEGVASIMFAFEHRRDQAGRWTWMLERRHRLDFGSCDYFGPAWRCRLGNRIAGGHQHDHGWGGLIGMALHARQLMGGQAAARP